MGKTISERVQLIGDSVFESGKVHDARMLWNIRDEIAALERQLAEANTTIESSAEELDRYRNGFQGGCYACETVALQNQSLLKEIRNPVRRRLIQSLRNQLAEAQEKAFKAGYHTGHGHTVEGRFQWCGEGTDDVYRDWLQDIAAEAQQENPND